ncbi:GTP-binding protein [Nesterenkonia sp. HG001]|uniref:GTP-binding protein n=1 Tax=Nesterenkonia sp. HG001 TaxID=2983207 RepID=UPI002AC631F6|nr:GTP-binding protein [Nesterenkonia sp. HG001]MDZ5078841.1 GTP-binding protein [Nesterenkonia sp. HG001]
MDLSSEEAPEAGGIGRRVDVVAVVGACGPERQEHAERLATSEGRVLLPARRLRTEPEVLDQAVSLLGRMRATSGLVVEHPLETPAMEIIGMLADPSMPTRLSAVICVVDATHLVTDLEAEDFVPLLDGTHHAARAELMVQQIEYASEIVLVNTAGLSARRIHTLEALLSALSPQASVSCAETRAAEPRPVHEEEYSQEQTRAGWVSLLNADFDPSIRSEDVTVVHYEQLRPFHPGRLHAVLETYLFERGAGQVVRSAGFCRLATRPHVTAQWDHVGAGFALEPLSFDHQMRTEDEVLAFGQELAIFGLGLDADRLTAALDEAALDDDELAAGPMLWATFPDPFPDWRTAPNL